MARPCKLTQVIQDRILTGLRAGAYLKTAAASAGVDASTLRRWLADPRPRFVTFRERVRQAEAEGELLLAGRVAQAAAHSPATAVKLLERRYPARYGRHRLEFNGVDPLAIPEEPSPAEEGPDSNVFNRLSDVWKRFIMDAMVAGLSGDVDPRAWFHRATHRHPLLSEDSDWAPAWWAAPVDGDDKAGH